MRELTQEEMKDVSGTGCSLLLYIITGGNLCCTGADGLTRCHQF